MRRTLFQTEHDDFRAAVRQFVEKEIVPYTGQWAEAGILPRELFTTAGAAGLLSTAIPEEYGGGGAPDFRFNLVLSEETTRVGAAAAGLGITLHTDIGTPYFLSLGNEEQKQRWLPGIASGELITAIAMTEPGIGSDLASMSTTARRDGDEYVVNGAKTFITNGINADLVITAVKTDPAQRHRGMTLLVLERGMAGFERGRNLDKMGQHAQDTAELFFDDARVPAANLLGAEGEGFRHLTSNLPQERLSIAVSGVAAARAALDWTLEYVQQRTAFGQPIGSFQNSRFAWPRWPPRSTSPRPSSTSCVPGPERRRASPATPPRPSGGAPSCRAGRRPGRPVARRLRVHGRVPHRRAYADARITASTAAPPRS